MRFFTTSRLSEHIRQTPEGYLICEAVPIARTGSMCYAPDEVPDDVTDGLPDDRKDAEVLVYRKAAEVFAPATLASFEGKPLVIDHPDGDVTPDTWADLAVGHIQNVRRGDPGRGEADDLMLADIVVTRADAIEAVNAGLRELSCGYDATIRRCRPVWASSVTSSATTSPWSRTAGPGRAAVLTTEVPLWQRNGERKP